MKYMKSIILSSTALLAASGLTGAGIAVAQSGSAAGTDQEAPVAEPAGAIGSDQAAQAAEKATGQTAGSVQLDDENGTVVYEVQAGGSEVAVEATTGRVMKVENGDDEESSDSQSVEAGDNESAETADDTSAGGQETGD